MATTMATTGTSSTRRAATVTQSTFDLFPVWNSCSKLAQPVEPLVLKKIHDSKNEWVGTCFSPSRSGRGSTEVAYLHPTGLILGIPKNLSLDVAEIYWRHCLEQWTEAWKCQSNPSRTGKWHASNTKKYIFAFASLNRFLDVSSMELFFWCIIGCYEWEALLTSVQLNQDPRFRCIYWR